MDKKIYINITNKCDYECPFCCMYSTQQGNIFMSFDSIYKLIKNELKNNVSKMIVQLEGGEPLLHPNIYLFLEYLCSNKYIDKVVIDTNGKNILKHIDRIISISENNKKIIEIKPSINSYLLSKRKDLVDNYKNIYSSIEFLKYVKMEFNVRYINEEDKNNIFDKIGWLNTHSNYHQFNKYGRANNENLPEIKITNTYSNWSIYSCDARCFNKDLIKRSEHELFLKHKYK